MSIQNTSSGLIATTFTNVTEYTISGWVYADTSVDEVYVALGGAPSAYGLRRNGTTLSVRNYSSPDTDEISAGAIAVNSTWTHHAVTVSSSNQALNNLFVNGVKYSSPQGVCSTYNRLVLHGQYYDGGSMNRSASNHRVANAAWWSAILTDEEINSLAKGFRPSRIRPQSLLNEAMQLRTNQLTKGGSWSTFGIYTPTVHPHPRTY